MSAETCQIFHQDPKWTEVSASLRKGKLYVKVPHFKVPVLIQALLAAEEDLLSKEILESTKAFVFYGPTDDWNEDLTTLRSMKTQDLMVVEFALAIEAGLRNEAQVDWISRAGGPPPEVLDALENLSPASEAEEVLDLS